MTFEWSVSGCTLASFGCGVNLLQTYVQSGQKDPRQIVGFVSLLCHYQSQLRRQEGDRKQVMASSDSRHSLYQLPQLHNSVTTHKPTPLLLQGSGTHHGTNVHFQAAERVSFKQNLLDPGHLAWTVCHLWGRAAHFQDPNLKEIICSWGFILNKTLQIKVPHGVCNHG